VKLRRYVAGMPNIVIDTTVLVSAFLCPSVGGASFDLIQLAHEGGFDLFLFHGILEEAAWV
jgi:predicted nucleic acid-binding protein